MMGEGLSFRLYSENDLDSLIKLWASETDWGPVTAEDWIKWFRDTPYGASIVAVAVTEQGEVAGQLMLVLSMVLVEGQEVAAGRVIAPILHRAYRHRSLLSPNHPVAEMSRILLDNARHQGIQLVYSFPERAWRPWFNMAERFGMPAFATAEFPHYRISVEDATFVLSERVTIDEAQEVDSFGHEYDALWQCCIRQLPIKCGVIRSANWLHFVSGRFQVLETRDHRSGELIGYSSVQKANCIIMDMFAANSSDQTRVLASTLEWTVRKHHIDPNSSGLNHLNVLGTPQIEPQVRELGFTRESDVYAFACCSLAETLPAAAVAPERWYLMLGD